MLNITLLTPDTMGKPIAPYANTGSVTGFSQLVFVAGQVGADKDWNVPDTIEGQCIQMFANIEAGLAEFGAGWKNVVQFTSYLVSEDDVAPFRIWRETNFPKMFGGTAFPTNALLIVKSLVSPKFRVEVQTIAAI